MSAQANVAIFDGAAAPVLHTLVPVGVAKIGKMIEASWREAILTLPIYAQIRLTTRFETLKSGVMRLSAATTVPVMESIGSQNASGYTAPPKVAYETTFVTTEYKNPRSTTNDSRLCKQLHVNFLVTNGASTVPTTTGPGPEFFDSAIMPS